MYKVFVNDKPIILTSSSKELKNYSFQRFNQAVFSEIIFRLKHTNLRGVILTSSNLEKDWKTFCKHFKIITAAGGLVLNDNKEILFIYRGEKWDLPKGRSEIGENFEETAVREVEEECGIKNLTIKNFLLRTHHIFYQNKEYRLKETYWYLMISTFNGALTPQLEEGITKVVFKNDADSKKALGNTFANIKLVYKKYQEVTT